MTLRKLATHTSGLPRLPHNLLPLRCAIPPTRTRATPPSTCTARCARPRTRPRPVPLLNYGFGLLGDLLSHTAGPLRRADGRADHRATRAHRDRSRYRTATSPRLVTVAAAHRPMAPGRAGRAGALNSTEADLARFLSANLHPETTPLRSAIEAIQRPAVQPGDRARLAICPPAGRSVLWHNGATGGFSAMLALDRAAGRAIGAAATAAPARRQPLDGAVFTALTELIQPGPGARQLEPGS